MSNSNKPASDSAASQPGDTAPASVAAGASASEGLPADPARRSFFTHSSSLLMAGGLVAGYGSFTWLAGRYLYPDRPPEKAWMYVTDLGRLKVGESMAYRTPAGARVTIARQTDGADAAAFIALDSTCPHLGCQVHWEAAANRFFCPCHNGAFDPAGKGISGPPGDAKQSLARYSLKVEGNLLFIEVLLTAPTQEQTARGGEAEGSACQLRPRPASAGEPGSETRRS